LSILAEALFGIEPAISQWVLNIPLFLAGLKSARTGKCWEKDTI